MKLPSYMHIASNRMGSMHTEYPDLRRSYDEIAIDLETRDPVN